MTFKSSPSYKALRPVVTRSLAAVAIVFVSPILIAGQSSVAQIGATARPVSALATHPCVQASVSGTIVSTALGECSAPSADAAQLDHFEADLRNGSFGVHQTDLVPYDFSALPLVRSYLSRPSPFVDAALDSNQIRAFGLNTTRSFDGQPVETKIIERNSDRGGNESLEEVRSPHGGALRFAFDGHSRIREADDDRNNTARYFYGSDGMLCYAFNTSGRMRHYTYDGNLMTAVEDEHRRTLVRNSYTAGHLIAQKYANGDVYKFAYTWLPSQNTAGSVTVTLPDHSVKVVSISIPAPSPLSTQ